MALGDDLVIGVSVNNVAGITGKAYSMKDLVHAGGEAEAMGFDAIWVHDAMMGRRTTAAYCPINALTAVAAQTKNLKLCTGILTPQVRNPVMTAQQWATLYEISEGRAIMGVGMGAGTPTLIKREFEGLASLKHGTDLSPAELYSKRGKVFDECMDVMRRLWSEDKLTYKGDYFSFNEITLGMARPPEMPPVLMGSGIYFPTQPGGPVHHGWKEKNAGKYLPGKLQRVVDYGDGWITVHVSPEEYAEHWKTIEAAGAEKFPGKKYAKAWNCFANVNDDPRKGWEGVRDHLEDFHGPPIRDDVVDRWAVAGPPEQMAARLQSYIDIGVNIFQLVIGSPDQLGQMRRIAEEVLPLLKR
ncbi:MAG: alkanesulfonate monooxygenase SsuD [Paracoccaceae bacterium]|jgi:alkanesulfonate monooxygenase SsuD/methylene tetrahydromethanopterin reductase-like flavin-dependent oxidoreductase (luciferase family)